MKFEKLVERLEVSPMVDGLVLLGSTGQPTQTSYSDRDLLVVLEGRPIEITNGTVFCEGVLVDLVVATRQDIIDLTQAEPGSMSLSDPRVSYFNWMPSGIILLDKRGCLAAFRDKVMQSQNVPSFGEGESIARADKALYNLAQTERMLESPDHVYQQAIDLRMLYQLADLMVDYFWVRGMPWKGEKDAIRYWQANDLEYLGLFMKCYREANQPERTRLYTQLVMTTIAPVGFSWDDCAMFRLSRPADMTLENLQEARAFWETLMS